MNSSAPVQLAWVYWKARHISDLMTIGYPVTKETLEKINSYADAIGYPVTRESLKNPKVRDTDILFKESLEELKAREHCSQMRLVVPIMRKIPRTLPINLSYTNP